MFKHQILQFHSGLIMLEITFTYLFLLLKMKRSLFNTITVPNGKISALPIPDSHS